MQVFVFSVFTQCKLQPKAFIQCIHFSLGKEPHLSSLGFGFFPLAQFSGDSLRIVCF